MSKQHVWFVEFRNDPYPWDIWSYHKTQGDADQACKRLAVANKYAQFRVAQYVRVEPAKKKGRKP